MKVTRIESGQVTVVVTWHVRPGHEQEFDAWRWVPHRELPELVVPFKRQVYEGVIREFERFVLASRR